MDMVPHLDFIAAAYAAAVIVIAVLISWVVLDYYAQRRALVELEMMGFARRSAMEHTEKQA